MGRRSLVRQRAQGRCEYCGMPESLDAQPFQVDHIRAVKHSGKSTIANLAWACLPCNAYKGPNVAGYDPDGSTLQPLFNPRKDQWSDHFAWKGPVLWGLTAVGRTTIDVLRINERDRVEHRRLLIALKKFPERPENSP